MSEVVEKIPYLQGLWRIRQHRVIAGQSRLSNAGKPRHPQPSNVNPTNKPEKAKPPPLREQMRVKHGQVIDINRLEFWKEHRKRIDGYIASQKTKSLDKKSEIVVVALLSGSLDRDRVDNRSCV